jgi:transposase
LHGAADKPFSAEQVEIARLKAELAKARMERDILVEAVLEGAPSDARRKS